MNFNVGHDALKATKNICCAKNEGAIDLTTVTRWFKKFCLVARTSMTSKVRSA